MVGEYERRLHAEHIARRARLNGPAPKPTVKPPAAGKAAAPLKTAPVDLPEAMAPVSPPSRPFLIGDEAVGIVLQNAERVAKDRVRLIQHVVAAFYGITVDEMLGPGRLRRFIIPRQVAFYLCRVHLKLSFPNISKRFGNRDHTTVIYGVRKVAALRRTDKQFDDAMSHLSKKLAERIGVRQ